MPPRGIPIRITEVPPNTDVERQLQEDALEREVDDLRAQQSMAEATSKIVNLSWFQLLLAAIGTAALVYSLYLNRLATSAALEAVRAERAWVLFRTTYDHKLRNALIEDKKVKDGLALEVVFSNAGRSPAIDTMFYGDWRFIKHGDPLPTF